MRYNPALDGVRAVAILLVVLFHAKVKGVPGGFLGVDVFFVLSGYLITRILSDEHHATGTIALGRFYLRRARRLYPALLGCSPAICCWRLTLSPRFQCGPTCATR